MKDFIGSTSWRDPNVPGTMYFSTENHGHVVRKGIEVSAGYAIGNFSVRANYGLVHATDKTTDERVPGVTPQSATLRLRSPRRPLTSGTAPGGVRAARALRKPTTAAAFTSTTQAS